jgi:hypothetical protein
MKLWFILKIITVKVGGIERRRMNDMWAGKDTAHKKQTLIIMTMSRSKLRQISEELATSIKSNIVRSTCLRGYLPLPHVDVFYGHDNL